jgi:hypothetical protein
MGSNAGRNTGTMLQQQRQDWHQLLDRVTEGYAGENVTIEVLDQELGDEYEAERMPLAYVEYDEHADMASVAVGGRDSRYPVVLRHGIEHPSEILIDSIPPTLPLAIEIVGGDGTRTVISICNRTIASSGSA